LNETCLEGVELVFQKGDKVVYPTHGAGVIEGLEYKNVDGQDLTYYVLNIPIGNLRISVSAKNAENLGIREIMPRDLLIQTISQVRYLPVHMSDNWNQRYKDNMAKIKTGNLLEVCEVFRNLRLREKGRSLSSAEKKVLSTAKQIILSEIILSHSVERPQAEEILEQMISC
jgi:CarD family transcriptional regulator